MHIFASLKIVPQLLGCAKALRICNLLLENSNLLGSNFQFKPIGTIFTFQHFIESFVHVCSESNISKNLSFHERFLIFLRHIEAHKSFGNFINFSLLKAPQVLDIITSSNTEDQEINETLSQTLTFEEIRLSNLLEDLEDIFRSYST